MCATRYSKTALSLTALLTSSAFAANEEKDGFMDGATLSVLNRNFFFSQDYRNGDFTRNPSNGERQSQHREWGHGVIADLRSGFTPGTVGFGVDVQGLLGLKLDGGNGTVGNGVGVPGIVPRSGPGSDGEPKDSYGKVGAALKVRAFDTELRYGDVRPSSPVLHASDIRLLPQTLRGFIFNNTSLEGLTLQGGKLESSSDRSASSHRGDLGTVYAGRLKGANDVVYLGGDYRFNDRLTLRLHTSRLDDVWNQSFFSVDHAQALGDNLSLSSGLNYYRTRDSGQALAGPIDNDAWSVHTGLAVGAHAFKLSYTRIDGDTPFDYVWNTYDLQLDAASQISDFNNPNERAWEARYDYNFAALGVPGLSLTARYVRGADIDGTRATGAYRYYNGIENGRHWERNLWLTYVVQSGPVKDLSFNLLQATHRVGGGHSAEANVDEMRLIAQYPLDIGL
ncbi:OprD family porin [Pseudomonas sp.]|uniref:OprD family porin n=1 Tax=Pseudomonas sp. TaxID=306 RepID=UPI0028A72425|nr:OprD family porin [Pseudomonas sp.]